ncbi:MAG: glutamine--fructose-6-phosphate transaminase (isomerizing) [Clostridia bacterium]|nr:glutamine--fructose-6-phosphate transaminase (isomerizing) [Clostridia bacterium]
MCGIIGYTGSENALPKMTEGLSVLEYRGYDSVGVAAETDAGIEVVKCRGRIGDLKARHELDVIESTCAIGHTRWATHGGPSDVNAHPHQVGQVVLVHNGIIENYKELKEMMGKKGGTFLSETDTEVAAAVLNDAYASEGEPIAAIRRAMTLLRGSYAFAILFADHPGEVYAARFGSPLILAKGADGYYLASDLTALLPFTREYCAMEEGQIAALFTDHATLYPTMGEARAPKWSVSNMTPEAAQKGGYEHFMLKEIYEQPEAIVKSLSSRTQSGLPDFGVDGIDESFWREVNAIQIVACGSAMHAGLVGARLLEDYAKVPTSVHIASEYRYHPPLSQKGTLVIVISQSGETADSLAALRYAKSVGLPTLAIVNAVETTIAREADRRIYTYAGPEIAVATTKGYCTQVSVLYLIAAAIAHVCGKKPEQKIRETVQSLLTDAPQTVSLMLEKYKDEYRRIAEKLVKAEHIFYIGRGISYAMSMEGSLKLKEISYIHAEAYAAGELKHGTISLIEEGTPVIAISTEASLYDKTESNVREVASRGARVVLICRDDTGEESFSAEDVLLLPTTSDAATLFGAMTVIQMLAYETAFLRGCDIDRPRNLAKSVTVE